MTKSDQNTGSAEGQEPERPRKGRPVVIDSQKRRSLILEALDSHFQEVGLQGMTMAAIAQRAGMSKQTLYTLFQDRDALFDAYLDDRFACLLQAQEVPDERLGFADRVRLLFRFDAPAEAWELPVALFRLAVVEAPKHPRLARRCLEEGPRSKQALLLAELERARDRGEIRVSDPNAAAALLMDMLHLPLIDALVDPNFRPETEAWRQRFELGLSVFLRGIS